MPVLPDVFLIEVFKLLPLLDLFKSIGLVNKRWRALLYEHELQCRKTLILYSTLDKFERSDYIPNDEHHNNLLEHVRKDDGSRWMQPLPTEAQIRFNLMPMRHFTSDGMIESNIMPNITHLTLIDKRVTVKSEYDRMIRLIRSISSNLLSLKLNLYFTVVTIGHYDNDKILSIVLAFFEMLNNIATLRHLDLKMESARILLPTRRMNTFTTGWITLPDTMRLSFLSHLHTFCLETKGIDGMIECFCNSFPQYASENVNLKICLHHELKMNKMLLLEPQLANKFTQIQNQLHIDRNEQLTNERYLTLFSSLTSLSLYIDQPYMMAKLTHHLQLLPNLVCLKLEYADFDKDTQWDDPSGQPEHYVQLPSVRLLSIEINTFTHYDIAKLSIPTIFPNVQVIHELSDTLKCSECDYDFDLAPDAQDPKLINKMTECVYMEREPYRACPKMHAYKMDNQPVELELKIYRPNC